LPTRAITLLTEAGIETVNEVVNTSREALLNIKGMGEKSLDGFMEALMEKVEVEIEVVEEVEFVDDDEEDTPTETEEEAETDA